MLKVPFFNVIQTITVYNKPFLLFRRLLVLILCLYVSHDKQHLFYRRDCKAQCVINNVTHCTNVFVLSAFGSGC